MSEQPPQFRRQFYRRERKTIPAAREFARAIVKEWGCDPRMDDVLLCVSELATNAVMHGAPPGRGYQLRFRLRSDGVLRVEVHDSGPGVPVVRVSAEEESGRGLLLVAALADQWGIGERAPGKVVWCEFATAATVAIPAAVSGGGDEW
ncbi:ATP-binding protein [Streptomyces sp. CAU 1734]|uniref:ATP-binding protein n=1 Tax=Streptomyces sp. CAU 1734 TaxID=3140360 RepID=UPI0032618B78